MHLEGADIFQAKPSRGPAEIARKLRYRVDVGSLRGGRQIADRHVLDHATAQRAHLDHLDLLFWNCASTAATLQNRSIIRIPGHQMPRQRLRSIPCSLALQILCGWIAVRSLAE